MSGKIIRVKFGEPHLAFPDIGKKIETRRREHEEQLYLFLRTILTVGAVAASFIVGMIIGWAL